MDGSPLFDGHSPCLIRTVNSYNTVRGVLPAYAQSMIDSYYCSISAVLASTTIKKRTRMDAPI